MTKAINFKVFEIAIRGSPNAYVSNPIVGLSAGSLKNMVDRGHIRAELSYITWLEFHGLLLQNLSMRHR